MASAAISMVGGIVGGAMNAADAQDRSNQLKHNFLVNKANEEERHAMAQDDAHDDFARLRGAQAGGFAASGVSLKSGSVQSAFGNSNIGLRRNLEKLDFNTRLAQERLKQNAILDIAVADAQVASGYAQITTAGGNGAAAIAGQSGGGGGGGGGGFF